MKDLSPYELEEELIRLKNELGSTRERMNKRASDHLSALTKYKKRYAEVFMQCALGEVKKSMRECDMIAQKETAEDEALSKATEQLILNERKAADILIEECEITRSLYAHAFKEMEQYHKKGE